MAKASGMHVGEQLPKTKFDAALDNWLAGVKDFEAWQQQLNEVIAAYTRCAKTGGYAGDQRAVVNLGILQEDLSAALKGLATIVDQRHQLGGPTLDQLIGHTKMVRQWSSRIQYALFTNVPGMA